MMMITSMVREGFRFLVSRGFRAILGANRFSRKSGQVVQTGVWGRLPVGRQGTPQKPPPPDSLSRTEGREAAVGLRLLGGAEWLGKKEGAIFSKTLYWEGLLFSLKRYEPNLKPHEPLHH
jgi:hypothetical protein